MTFFAAPALLNLGTINDGEGVGWAHSGTVLGIAEALVGDDIGVRLALRNVMIFWWGNRGKRNNRRNENQTTRHKKGLPMRKLPAETWHQRFFHGKPNSAGARPFQYNWCHSDTMKRSGAQLLRRCCGLKRAVLFSSK